MSLTVYFVLCYNAEQSNEGNKCLYFMPDRQGEPALTESGLLAESRQENIPELAVGTHS